MKKRFLTALLSLSMVLGLSAPALAVEVEEAQVEAAIEAEIRAMEEEVYADVYRQLEEQDGLHMMDTYKEILAPKIRAAVEEKYASSYSPLSISPFAVNANWTKYARVGGLVTYMKVGYVEVGELYMNKDDTAAFVKKVGQRVKFYEVVKEVLGLAIEDDAMNYASQALMTMVIAMDTLPTKQIEDCGGYAYIITTYEPTIPATYSIVMPWTTYPNIVIDRSTIYGSDPVYTPPKQ